MRRKILLQGLRGEGLWGARLGQRGLGHGGAVGGRRNFSSHRLGGASEALGDESSAAVQCALGLRGRLRGASDALQVLSAAVPQDVFP